MSEAQLPAPIPGTDAPEAEPKLSLTPDVQSTSPADDQVAMDNSYNRIIKFLKSQPLRRVRVPEHGLYVQINGWKAFYAAGVHEVPEAVEQIWIDAKRI